MINLVKKQKYQARQKKNAQYNQKKSSKYKTMLLKIELRVEINKKRDVQQLILICRQKSEQD